MPMPHRTQQQLIKRRLVGKDGAERIRELHAILAELPGYRNGPYADLRKWVEGRGAALLAVLRSADDMLRCRAGDRRLSELDTIRDEVAAAGIELPGILAATKCDEGPPPGHPELPVLPVSVLDDESLDRLRE